MSWYKLEGSFCINGEAFGTNSRDFYIKGQMFEVAFLVQTGGCFFVEPFCMKTWFSANSAVLFE